MADNQLNKSDLVAAIAASADISKAQSARVLDSTLSVIVDTLAGGKSVSVAGFGTFSVRQRAERQGINLSTREKITIPATQVPAFKAGKRFKEAVKNS